MSETHLQPSGEILNGDGESVGWLNYTDNKLRNLEIEPAHRQQGHASAAFEQFLDLARDRGYDKVRVCMVVNDFMGAIIVDRPNDQWDVANPDEPTDNKDYFVYL